MNIRIILDSIQKGMIIKKKEVVDDKIKVFCQCMIGVAPCINSYCTVIIPKLNEEDKEKMVISYDKIVKENYKNGIKMIEWSQGE
jgi:hypothetical protein